MNFSDLLNKPVQSSSIISKVNNDVNSINFAKPSGDKPSYLASPEAFGDYWDSYEMGMTFEQATARWEAAQTPEAKAKVLEDLKARAISRADLDVRDGRVRLAMVEGTDDWHGLGTRFTDNPTGLEMLRAAGLDAEVMKVAVNHNGQEVKGVYLLGYGEGEDFEAFDNISVGSGYQVVQDADVMEFMEAAFKSAGAKFSSAGAIKGGQTSFWCCEMPEGFEIMPGDEVKSHLTVHNSHGMGSVKAFGANHRSVCSNTHRQALAACGKKSINFRHTRNVKARMGQVAKAINAQQSAFEKYKESAESMVRTQASPSDFAQKVVDHLSDTDAGYEKQYLNTQQRLEGLRGMAEKRDLTPGQMMAEYKRREKKTDKFIDNILKKYHSDTNTAPGTVWASYNAVTEYANHDLKYRADDQQEARFESLLDGRAAIYTDAAYEVAQSVCS